MPQGWITEWEVLTKIDFLNKHSSQNLGELYAEEKNNFRRGPFFPPFFSISYEYLSHITILLAFTNVGLPFT